MNKTTKSILTATAIVAVSAGVAGFTSYSLMQPKQIQQTMNFEDVFQVDPNTRLAALDATQMQPVDLTKAAESSVNAVVHIKSTQEAKTQTVTVRDPFYEFFGDMFGNRGGQQRQVQTPERVGFGSGVIISKDGYIDADEALTEQILLELPLKHLCKEDCKGLCPKCGTDLNKGSCCCDTSDPDPRFDVLRKLLENKKD